VGRNKSKTEGNRGNVKLVLEKEGFNLSMDMEFMFTSPLILEETAKNYVMVEATLLTEGLSKRGKLYTIDDTDFYLVAETALNKPVYYGTNIFGEHKAPPVKGIWSQLHSGVYGNVKPIGKLVKTWVDRVARKVKAKIKIWDKDIMHRIKEGFKISVRGLFDSFKYVMYKGRKALKPLKLRIKDIQLLEPTTRVGVSGAKVERILEETMSFNFRTEEEDMIIATLVREGII